MVSLGQVNSYKKKFSTGLDTSYINTTHTIFLEQSHPWRQKVWLGEEGKGGLCSMGTEFHFGEMKSSEDWPHNNAKILNSVELYT